MGIQVYHVPILKGALEMRDREFTAASNMYKANRLDFEKAHRMIRNAQLKYREAILDFYEPGFDISPSSGRVKGKLMAIPYGEVKGG